jgi:hypothetical protein
MEKWDAQNIYNLEGLNRAVSDFSHAVGEFEHLENASFDKVGQISKRLGYVQKGLTGVTTSTSTSTSTTTSTSTSTSTSTTA